MTREEAIEKAIALIGSETWSADLRQAVALESLAWSAIAALLPDEKEER